jgi:hypothetical protein
MKNSAAKWVALSTIVTAAVAFAAGVAYELHAIKKLTVDVDVDDEETAAPEETEEIVEEVVEEIEATEAEA